MLEACPTVKDATSRQLWLEMVEEELGQRLDLRNQTRLRPLVVELTRTCAAIPAGLDVLVDVLAALEGESSREVSGLRSLMDEWSAVEFFADADWTLLQQTLNEVTVRGHVALGEAATEGRVRIPPRCTDAWTCFAFLTGVNSPSGTLPPSMVFLELLAEQIEDPVGVRVLRQWNQRWAHRWNLTAELENTRWRRSPEKPEPASTARLIIQLDPDGVDPDSYTLSYWQEWDAAGRHCERGEDRLVKREDLELVVEELVERMEDSWAERSSPVWLEFFLPWELLNAPVEWWAKETRSDLPSPLIGDYPIIVRSLERLRMRKWHRPWRQRWQHLTNRPADSRAHWSNPVGEDHVQRLEMELKADDHLVSLVLSEPPLPDGGTGQQEVLVALRAGLPVIIWNREDCSTEAFRAVVAELLADAGLANLPGHARQLKLDASRLDPVHPASRAARNLTVLWDDPGRQPGGRDASGFLGEGWR
ncbi:hypothetical protein GCM10012280_42360 [Wenjunlia tyrosinilytica]|uniref:Uncharacterized protein n=1 Tax=Wenjunlia tyrosinilytica TaxID=1544741 RepID=A0A917ZSC4_9ACTN|nr:hypothetical protein GCM10012280_42360 [Wenjunlia tyrosinilytica]